MCARASIETVSQQYDGLSIYTSETKNQEAEVSKNKLTDMLVGCPEFGAFFQTLETKDKRLFVSICEVVEIKSEKKVISEYSPCSSVIIVLKGELISFTKEGPGDVFRAGEILGTKQLLFDLCWRENIYGRQNGYLVKIKKDYLFDVGNSFAKTAMNITNYLVRVYCEKTKHKYKEARPVTHGNNLLEELNINEEEEKANKKAAESNRFAELYINQKLRPMMAIESTNDRDNEIFKVSKDTAPITALPVYKTIVKQDVEKTGKEDKNLGALNFSGTQRSCFLKEKLENQLEDRRRRDREIRLRKKKGLPYEELLPKEANNDLKGVPPNLEALETEYEKLKNDYNLRELSRERLSNDHDKLQDRLKQTEEEVKHLKDKIIFVTAERDRLKLHKELLNKVGSIQEGESLVNKLTKTRGVQRNFNDVVDFRIIQVQRTNQIKPKVQDCRKMCQQMAYLNKKKDG